MGRKKIKKKVNLKSKNPQTEMNADGIDASSPTYTNCLFYNYNIDSAYISPDSNFVKKQDLGVQEQNQELIKQKLIDYVSNVGGFSPELVERVLDFAEKFMKEQFGRQNNDLM